MSTNAAQNPDIYEASSPIVAQRNAFLAIVALSIAGEYLSNIWPNFSVWYWATLIPVFAIISLMTELLRLKSKDISLSRLVFVQATHWGGSCIALAVIYAMWSAGRFTNDAAGSAAIVILALTTFLSGYHAGWRFYLAGVLLFAYTLVALYMKGFFWLSILLTIPIILMGWYWERHPPRNADSQALEINN